MVVLRRSVLSLILILFCSSVVSANQIVVTPAYQFVNHGTTFNVSIHCIPTQPIKAFEFKIEYNSSLLLAENVTEGDFFRGYQSFFIPGIIQQDQGRIINIYGLIMGQGNISVPGTFVIIRFTAKEQEGVSSIHLYDMGITNETQYLSVDVNDGDVQTYVTYYPWDINEDYRTNYIDISLLISHYGNTFPPGSEPWDIIIDGIVNYKDVSILCYHYGEIYG